MTATPVTLLMGSFPDGRQLLQVHDLTLSIPKDTDKYYHASIAFRGGPSDVRGILHNPKRHLRIDGSGYIDSVYILSDPANILPVARDAVESVEILGELSQAEYDEIAARIRRMMDRTT